MTDKLERLLSMCKCGVYLTVNEHLDYYETVERYLDEQINGEVRKEIDEDVYRVMVDKNTVIELHFYPDTPIGFYKIWHHSVDQALDKALKILESTNDR